MTRLLEEVSLHISSVQVRQVGRKGGIRGTNRWHERYRIKFRLYWHVLIEMSQFSINKNATEITKDYDVMFPPVNSSSQYTFPATRPLLLWIVQPSYLVKSKGRTKVIPHYDARH